MKTIKQLLLLLLLVLITANASSKENLKVRGDSIRIRFENCLLEVATFDLKSNTLTKAEIAKKINVLLEEVKKIDFNSPDVNTKISITYSGFIGGKEHEFSRLTMTSEENRSKSFTVNEGELLETDFGNIVLEVEDENYLIRLYLEKLDDAQIVNSAGFSGKIESADSAIPENRKKTYGWLIENNKQTFNPFFLGETAPYTLDMLELNAGVGAELIQNQFVSGFNFRIGLAFAKKGIMKNKYFANYELFYDFSNPPGNNKFSINGFLTLGYEKNFSLDPNKTNWYGISLGYLLDRGNDFFEKNTYKLAVHKSINNSITLKPGFYFNDFFKNGNPALGVQITF